MFLGDWAFVLLMLKAGRRVRRQGWMGKDMWIALAGAGTFALSGLGGIERMPLEDFVVMFAANQTSTSGILGGRFVPWVPSQDDLLANDWEEVALG